MRVADVMETRVDVADKGMQAEQACADMHEHGLFSLVVTDGERILGVVSRDRLETPDGSAGRRDRTLADYLPHDPVAVPAHYPIARAAELLEGDASGCVAVLDNGRLVGVLTMSGLLHRLAVHGARSCAS